MFKSFIAWLDSYIAGEEPSALAKSIVGLMSFAVLLGAIVGNAAVKAGALVAVLLFVLYAFLALLADRRRLTRSCEKDRRIISRFCSLLRTRLDSSWELLEWDQLIKIDGNGDAVQEIRVYGLSTCAHLDFYQMSSGSGWDQPEKYRKRIAVKARTLDVSGIEGPQCDVTSWWEEQRLTSIIHFPEPMNRGEEFRLAVEYVWPGKCSPLMRDGRREQFLIARTPVSRMLRYRVQVPAKFDLYVAPIGIGDADDISLVQTRAPSGATEVAITACAISGKRRVGMTLELK